MAEALPLGYGEIVGGGGFGKTAEPGYLTVGFEKG